VVPMGQQAPIDCQGLRILAAFWPKVFHQIGNGGR
jgi:hypothetical protein